MLPRTAKGVNREHQGARQCRGCWHRCGRTATQEAAKPTEGASGHTVKVIASPKAAAGLPSGVPPAGKTTPSSGKSKSVRATGPDGLPFWWGRSVGWRTWSAYPWRPGAEDDCRAGAGSPVHVWLSTFDSTGVEPLKGLGRRKQATNRQRIAVTSSWSGARAPGIPRRNEAPVAMSTAQASSSPSATRCSPCCPRAGRTCSKSARPAMPLAASQPWSAERCQAISSSRGGKKPWSWFRSASRRRTRSR